MPEELHPLLRFRPFPWPGPDPASLLHFFVEVEQPAVRQKVLAAYLQLSMENLQAQVKFVDAVQKATQGR
jgi:hypothetical protein